MLTGCIDVSTGILVVPGGSSVLASTPLLLITGGVFTAPATVALKLLSIVTSLLIELSTIKYLFLVLSK